MTKKILSMMEYWPILMLGFAGVSSGFAFYHSMQNLQIDVQEITNMLVRKESIDLELQLRDTVITDLKEKMNSLIKNQEIINRDFEDDIKYLHRNTR
tara:strand:+ start:4157 stop:4447 length:291 start_codon:yes stop_codon:yes gene_type:complete